MSQRGAVRALFDDKAAAWHGKYERGILTPRLLRFETALAELKPPPARLLDFGCGTGALAAHLAGLGYDVVGADLSEQMLTAARTRYPDLEFRSLGLAPGGLPFGAGEFDVVIASSVLEYATPLGSTLLELGRVLRPGGVLLATVPDTRTPVRRAEVLAQHLLRFVPRVANALSSQRSVVGSRTRDFIRYLQVSRNRLDSPAWDRLLRDSHFVSAGVGRVGHREPLTMLAYRRL